MTLVLHSCVTVHLRAPFQKSRAFNPMLSAADQPKSPPAWKRRIPNMLTMARVFAIPGLAGSFLHPAAMQRRIPALIFVAVGMTDWLDGYLARRWKVQVMPKKIIALMPATDPV